MKRFQISSVDDLNFGVHRSRFIKNLAHDFVCIYGVNESGKSTLAEYLQWSIGGPAGTAANALRFVGTDETKMVGGTLFARIDGGNIELTSNFKIKLTGTPNDDRRALFQSRQLDIEAVKVTLGNVNADDYALINRLRGADLGQGNQADSFSDLFTRFAIGSSATSVNPRERLSVLQKDAGKLASELKSLDRAKRKLRDEITTAERRPAELDEFEKTEAEQQEEIERLQREIGDIHQQRNLVKQARNMLPARKDRYEAEAALDTLGPMSDVWRRVARTADAVASAHSAADLQVEEVERKAVAFADARAKVGLDASTLEGCEFSVVQRSELHQAATTTAAARANRARMTDEITELRASVERDEAVIEQSTAALGIQRPDIPKFIGRAGALRNLAGLAALWTEAAADAANHEDIRIGQFGEATTFEDNPQSATLNHRFRIRISVVVAGLIIALVAASQNAYIAIAIFAIFVIGALLFPDTDSPAGESDQELVLARRDLATATKVAEQTRSKAQQRSEELTAALLSLDAPSVSIPSMAEGHVERLAQFAEQVTAQASTRSLIDDRSAAAEACDEALTEANAILASLLRARGIESVPSLDLFTDWLNNYEAAITAAREKTASQSKLEALLEARDALVEPIAIDLAGLTSEQVLMRVRDEAARLTNILAAEQKLNEARIAIAAVGDSATEIEALLTSHGEGDALTSLHQEFSDRLNVLNAQLEQAVGRRDEAIRAIKNLYDSEVLALLHGERIRLEDDQEEVRRRHEVIERSATILAAVIERYESENQDPLIKEAQALASRVVPDWGDLLFRRDDNGKVVIERRDSVARLEDSKLSDGARALLYLALRLAFASRDAESRGIALPILCDDPLVHLDDVRRDGAIALLADTSKNHQVVLFTCDTGTRDRAASAGAQIVLI